MMEGGMKLTYSRIEPGRGSRGMVDEVDLAFGCGGLLPAVGQRAQRVARRATTCTLRC